MDRLYEACARPPEAPERVKVHPARMTWSVSSAPRLS